VQSYLGRRITRHLVALNGQKSYETHQHCDCAALLIAGCSTNENQSLASIQQANESQTTVGLQEQQKELETLVACERPPITVEWARENYNLKEKNHLRRQE
jgi:hypothetical protein